MKTIGSKRKTILILFMLSLPLLNGCGGYARTPGSKSGVEMYGVVDVGVQRKSAD